MKKFEHEMPREFVRKVRDLVQLKEIFNGEVKKISDDGQDYWYQDSVMPIFDDNGERLGEVIVRFDITDKKYYEKLAITDSMTHLYNRRYFNEILSREINRAYRDQKTLSFIILDVDYFKKYNDSYGHNAGDEVLQNIAKSIKDTLHRGSDYAFRLGGEEFGIIFSGLDKNESLELAEKIRSNVENLNIEHIGSPLFKCVTISLGLLVVDFAQESIDEHGFYTMADTALYKAKENGRNRVVIYENEEVEFF